MRCFFAIELSPPIRSALARVIRDWTGRVRGVRWCDPAQLHITLKFLGEIEPQQIADISQAAARAAQSIAPFDLSTAGLGAFPSPQRPRVLWCGVTDASGGAQRWLTAVDPPLEALGLPREPRPLHAHVTLARTQSAEGSAALRRLLERPPSVDALALTVEQVVLFESQLTPGGARHTALATYALAR